MSIPSIRAVPPEGGWKPSSVCISVLLPAPFGPSSPIARPDMAAWSSFRIGRPANVTDRRSSSTLGVAIPGFAGSDLSVAASFAADCVFVSNIVFEQTLYLDSLITPLNLAQSFQQTAEAAQGNQVERQLTLI